MKTLVFDGHNALWRLQMRLPELTANGKPVQVVYGFLRLLRSALSQFEPNVALVCWDSGRSKYRKKLFPEYKANRDEHHKDDRTFAQANMQLETIKGLLKYLNVAQLTYPDTEADDLIGIACYDLEGEKTIISSDKDMLHLVSEEVSVWSPIKTQLYTHKNFKDLTKVMEGPNKIFSGLSPKQWLEFRALTGDPSDNIPGVAPGLGEQTARELIDRFGSIDNLYSSSVEKKVHKMGNRYALLYSEGAKERVYRNLLLMDLSLPLHREDYLQIAKVLQSNFQKRKKVDRRFLRDYFNEQKFESLLKDLATWILPFEDLDIGEEQ